MNPDNMAQGNPARAYVGAANAPYITSGYAQVDALPQPSVTSLAVGLRGTANIAMAVCDRLDVVLSRLRGSVPIDTGRKNEVERGTPATIDILRENITSVDFQLERALKSLSELERIIGEQQ